MFVFSYLKELAGTLITYCILCSRHVAAYLDNQDNRSPEHPLLRIIENAKFFLHDLTFDGTPIMSLSASH